METKFDFEDENLEKDIKKNAFGLFNGILIFIQSVFRFNNDIDKNATINSIKNDSDLLLQMALIITINNRLGSETC